jgi:hypothetical protein
MTRPSVDQVATPQRLENAKLSKRWSEWQVFWAWGQRGRDQPSVIDQAAVYPFNQELHHIKWLVRSERGYQALWRTMQQKNHLLADIADI